MKYLESVLRHDGLPEPGSQGTYGISGASFFTNVWTMAVEGRKVWRDLVLGIPAPSGAFQTMSDIGERPSGVHDEVHHIMHYPGMQAVLATQPNCLFCYGLLEARGYQHGPIRENPWPQQWIHDYLNFRLKVCNEYAAATSHVPVVTIATQRWGTYNYQVIGIS